jgi:sugar/nucleoside kinase (ribokinase family)
MRVIGIGNLVLDVYYYNNILIGINGGKSFSNIIYNISNQNIDTAIMGACGNDYIGDIVLDSLKNIDISNVLRNGNTKVLNIYIDSKGNIKNTSYCSYCNKKHLNRNKINADKIIDNIDPDDIVVMDSINKNNLKIIDNINNKIMIDIGYRSEFIKLSNEEIINIFKNKFAIININNKASKYLQSKLKVSEFELYKLFNSKLLIVTRGDKGAMFYFDNKCINKEIINKTKEIDPNGAGDAFFATFISQYIRNNFVIDDNFIDKTFDKAITITSKVVSVIGARSHISNLYKKDLNDCIYKCVKRV